MGHTHFVATGPVGCLAMMRYPGQNMEDIKRKSTMLVTLVWFKSHDTVRCGPSPVQLVFFVCDFSESNDLF